MQGGKLFFLDIVSYPREKWFNYAAQKFIAPFWYFLTIGCKAGNIDAHGALTDAGFDLTRMQSEKHPQGQWAFNLYYFGVAIKPE